MAFGAQTVGAALFGGQISGFFGAAAMTPVVLWVETTPAGPPKLVTFLPAFWLLVPGAAGLITLTQIVGPGADVAANAPYDVTVAFISIALGVLIGTSLYRTARQGVRRIAGVPPSQ